MVTEIEISALLKELGIPADLLGYRYLIFCIDAMIKDPSLMYGMFKGIYPMVAAKFDTSITKAERAIRNVIEVGWTRGCVETRNKLFGYTVDANKGRPTNGEFLCAVADWFVMTERKVQTDD